MGKWHCFVIHIPWHGISFENLEKLRSEKMKRPSAQPSFTLPSVVTDIVIICLLLSKSFVVLFSRACSVGLVDEECLWRDVVF